MNDLYRTAPIEDLVQILEKLVSIWMRMENLPEDVGKQFMNCHYEICAIIEKLSGAINE